MVSIVHASSTTANSNSRLEANTYNHAANGAGPFQILGVIEWSHLARFLLPRDIHRLSQTCTRLHEIQQCLLKNVTEKTLENARDNNSVALAFLNAPPVAFLRLNGACGNMAAQLLSKAPNISQLDLRALTEANGAEIIHLASLHPNARVVLNASQKADLVFELLARATHSPTHAGTTSSVASAMNGGTGAQGDPSRAVSDDLPSNLVVTAAFETSSRSMRYPDEDSSDFNPQDEELQTQRLAFLSLSLLERCQREGLMEHPARLFMAIESIRRFNWNTPVHKHQYLLLLYKQALALENQRTNDPVTRHDLLSALAIAMDKDKELSISRGHNKPAKTESNSTESNSIHTSVAPEGLLATLLSWGLDPRKRDSRNETVFDHLYAHGLRQPAQLLKQATRKALAAHSARQAAASPSDLA